MPTNKSLTISIWDRKGGVGKTTIAATLARLRYEEKPFVLDLDGQRSTRAYEGILGQFGVRIHPIEVEDFHSRKVPEAALRIIDCPPDVDIARAALEISDIIIVPFYGDRSVWDKTVEAWEEIARMRHHAQVMGVMNLYKPASWMCRDTLSKAKDLMGDRLSKTVIRSREIMREADYRQLTIFDLAPDSPAAKQFLALNAEIEQLIRK